MVTAQQRRRFDDILDRLIDELPEHLHALLDEVPLIVEDEPSDEILDEMEIDDEETDLCGLHSGIPLTHRSVEQSGHVPDHMMLFRGPIYRASGRSRIELEKQIRITLLHEIGHHFGLDEDDLEKLGYG